jgi:AP-1 complex subunit beta-1
MDIGAPAVPTASSQPQSNVDLLGGGLDILLGGGQPTTVAAAPEPVMNAGNGLLGDIFGLNTQTTTMIAVPKITWLPAEKGKGLEIQGTFARRGGQVHMDMTFTNKAMQAMSGFAIQLNKNSFGLVPGAPLQVPSLPPGQTAEVSLQMNSTGPVMRMEPINNLQIAIKNNVDVFYFACLVHGHTLFSEEGQLDKRVFLSTWKEIPAANEVQYTLNGIVGNADAIGAKMTANNVFTIAKRNVEGQDMLYQSLKLDNNVWVLLELKLAPGSTEGTLSLKSRSVEVAQMIFTAYDMIIKSA